MPKRVVDGDGLWKSDKLALVSPDMKAEYANLIPLAHANGSFECNPRLVWSTVYAYNRPEITPERVADILNELEKVKLLFRWNDAGKEWGFWVGIDKAGRLPPQSRKDGGHEKLGAPVPQEGLTTFLSLDSNGKPVGSQQEASGSLGLGSGLGSGNGKGLGSRSGGDGMEDGILPLSNEVLMNLGIPGTPLLRQTIAKAIAIKMANANKAKSELPPVTPGEVAEWMEQRAREFMRNNAGTKSKSLLNFFSDGLYDDEATLAGHSLDDMRMRAIAQVGARQ